MKILSIAIFLSSIFTPVHGDFEEALSVIHSKLTLIHGSLQDEYPEQLMTAMFLPKDATVLELGGNVGRNSCVIASILNNSEQQVVMESNPEYIQMLQENRDINGLKFHIEASALSRVPLIQSGWNTKPSDEVLPGWIRVNTLNFDELQNKYDTQFDTLVVDCEGALYYILRDDPDILKNIKLIITENDYKNIEHLRFVQSLFKEYDFELIYNQAGGWPCIDCCCHDEFYQVWKKRS